MQTTNNIVSYKERLERVFSESHVIKYNISEQPQWGQINITMEGYDIDFELLSKISIVTETNKIDIRQEHHTWQISEVTSDGYSETIITCREVKF